MEERVFRECDLNHLSAAFTRKVSMMKQPSGEDEDGAGQDVVATATEHQYQPKRGSKVRDSILHTKS